MCFSPLLFFCGRLGLLNRWFLQEDSAKDNLAELRDAAETVMEKMAEEMGVAFEVRDGMLSCPPLSSSLFRSVTLVLLAHFFTHMRTRTPTLLLCSPPQDLVGPDAVRKFLEEIALESDEGAQRRRRRRR